VVVALERKVYVYGLRSLSLFDSIETISNPKGLCCLSVGVERAVLVCPGMQKGRALVVFYPRAFGDSPSPPERERTTIIGAHESVIAAMASDYGGGLLATASDRGTIIRVYDTNNGSRLQELRRGADRAEIHSLVFSPGGDWLALASDKGTVHIFAVHHGGCHASSIVNIGVPSLASGSMAPSMAPGSMAPASLSGGDTPENQKSSLSRVSRLLPAYFSSEWSLAQFRVPDFRCAAAFGADPHTVVIVCANGSYYKARFDPIKGGEMVREEFAQFDDATVEANKGNAGGPGPEATSASDSAPSSPAPAEKARSATEPEASKAAASGATEDSGPQTRERSEASANREKDAEAADVAAEALLAAIGTGSICRESPEDEGAEKSVEETTTNAPEDK
jgi:hypothetical protein